MENLKSEPKTNFSGEAQWHQMYLLTEQLYSDLQFYKDDLSFLYHLVDNYFMGLTHYGNLDEMRGIAKELTDESSTCDELQNKSALHLKQLAELIDAPHKYDSNQIRSEHDKLQNEVISFVNKLRKNKIEVFAITEKVIKKEIQKRLTA
ncbi:hypothetical protein [Flavobacterium sp. ACAM 123]|jgi:hypothetical protein|uniref:hypothetical protein n=1 Tax=Flavobacterium sp. ACAM 123 TaxID=1189620 RepID=UPI0002E08A84|nr:hypothetical protein [Flavobacterium sp. ACAM 123]